MRLRAVTAGRPRATRARGRGGAGTLAGGRPGRPTIFEQVEQRHLTPVAVVTAADADLLVTTLGVHGIEASAPATAAFPALDWAEGRAITVRAEDAAAAAELLRGFGHEPLPDLPRS